METKRQQKFGRQIQKDLSDIFQKEFKMLFGKGMVTVTEVKISPDLSVARCYLSFLLIDDREAVMDQIDLQNKAIRNALAKDLQVVDPRKYLIPSRQLLSDEVSRLLKLLATP